MAIRITDASLAVALIRVSTDLGRQGLGAEGQRKAIERWARGAGVTIASWHTEEVSGGATFEKRPVLTAALADVAARGAGLLVVQKIDRFSRDPYTAGIALAALAKCGATLATSDGAGAGDDASAVLMRDLLLAMARFDKANIRSRIKAALAVKKDRGELTGQSPFGMRAVDGPMRVGKDGQARPARILVENETEQATLATLRNLRASGLSLRQVTEAARSRGIVNRAGKPFHVSAIALLVGSPVGAPEAAAATA